MGVNALWSPAHRVLQRFNAGGASKGPDSAPSQEYLGIGLQDHRVQYNRWGGNPEATAVGVLGWYGNDPIVTLNVTPATKSTAGIAALANVSSGVAMTLAAASTGVTVASALTIWPGMVVGRSAPLSLSAGLVLDGVPGLKRFGSGFVTAFYDRTTMVGRAVSVTGVVSTVGGDFLVSGYDIYGYAMSETITAAAGVATTNGKKAFKVVTSVVPQFTDAHNYSVGTTDIFGLPIRADVFPDVLLHYNAALVTATTGFVAADTATATATTGDVRGTYALQSAADGTKRLTIRQSPILSAVLTSATSGLFGVAQF